MNEVLVLYNCYSRVVTTTSNRNLKEDVKKTFCDVLPSNATILLKIKDEAWDGMFVDLEEISPLPNKSVLQLHVMKES